MTDRPTPAEVIDDFVDTTEHTAGILAALADAGYHVVHAELVPAFSEAFAEIEHQRDLARETCERRTDQRNRAVRVLALVAEDVHRHPGFDLLDEPWVQEVLSGRTV